MAALYDPAFDSIELVADFDNNFYDALRGPCKISADMRQFLYAAGVTSMTSFGEFFPTHESTDDFIKSVYRKEGKTVDLPIYRNPAFIEYEFTLRFPLVQQGRLKALRLYAIDHAYAGIHFNLPLLEEPTILRFSIFATSINLGKTTKDVPDTGIPLLAPSGDVAANYAMWSEKFIDFMSNYRSWYTGAPLS
jgi:hypothetical protein